MSDDLTEVFVAEGRELADLATAALDALRGGEPDADALSKLFRAFHTLKGSAGLMDFAAMQAVFHAGEDRLDEARAGDGRLGAALIDALVAVLDQTEVWLDETAATNRIPTGAEPAAGALVERLQAGEAVAGTQDTPAGVLAPAETPLADVQGAARTLRVETARVDDLAAAADELIVLKNWLAELTAAAVRTVDPELGRALSKAQTELDRHAVRLHGAVAQLRMTPLGPVFRRFPRLVRETAASLGKAVALTVDGGEVEVDKTIVDALFEPLLHLLRNALDHGIETPEQRQAAGKPLPARVSLTARTAGEQAIIEVADDGRGVDLAAVRRAALERGVAEPETILAMDEAAAADLIFASGFSTVREVGDLSGRGVGLDAVRAAVNALGGRVSLTSAAGRGARFSIALPLGVRLARIMTVRVGEETFGLPLESIVETTRVAADRLTPVRAGRAFVWRDQAAPLLELAELLRLPQPPRREAPVVIVRAGGDIVGVAVDAFGERMELPLRPMTGLLAGAAGVAGTTLTGDGRVLMVLDLPELIG